MVGFAQFIAGLSVILFCLAPMARATTALAEKEGTRIPDKHMMLSGPIDARFVAAIAQISRKYPTIRVLVIDSEGGEVEAALQLAQLVRDHGWDVVVKNKCLSACANYVFPSGKHKIVLPNSWVGIHERTRRFNGADGSVSYVSGNEIVREMAIGKIDATSAIAARKWDADNLAFYRSLGLSTALVQDFADYVSYRKHVLGVEDVGQFPDVPGCPNLRMWALNKKQLEEMGVTGIDDFWFPANKEEERTLYKDKILPLGSIYIGGAEKLSTLCKGPALNAFQTAWLKRAPH